MVPEGVGCGWRRARRGSGGEGVLYGVDVSLLEVFGCCYTLEYVRGTLHLVVHFVLSFSGTFPIMFLLDFGSSGPGNPKS